MTITMTLLFTNSSSLQLISPQLWKATLNIPLGCSSRGSTFSLSGVSMCRMSVSGSSNNSGPPINFGRLGEFSSPGGDRVLQDELAREVLRQATRISSAETMEDSINLRIREVTELLGDLYTKSEKDIVERNEDIVRRASLENITKWNQQVMAGSKYSKNMRIEISKELEIVRAMLKRRRAQPGARPATKKNIARKVDGPQSSFVLGEEWPSRNSLGRGTVDVSSSGTNCYHLGKRVNERDNVVGVVKPLPALFFTLGTCTLLLESFESIASRENGSTHLAQWGTLTAIFIAVYSHAQSLLSISSKNRGVVRRKDVTDVNSSSDEL